MQYLFTCPLERCQEVMTIEANSDEEAIEKLSNKAKNHLALKHPDIKKTDEEVKKDIKSLMKKKKKPFYG